MNDLILDEYTLFDNLKKNIKSVVTIKDDLLNLILSCFFTGNHVLLEDNPGTGKTTLAKAIAKSIHLTFNRIQMTPDILPSDVTGVSIYHPKEQRFVFHKGPIFSQLFLADEINRASPKTQSSMLEAMAERQVTIDGNTEYLDELFFVIATQNSLENKGTYSLPEAQIDRFAIKVNLGYLSLEDEIGLLSGQKEKNLNSLKSVMSRETVLKIKDKINEVTVSDDIKKYIVSIVQQTRQQSGIMIGAGPRASMNIFQLSKAYAFSQGQDFVTPDMIKKVVHPVLIHRIHTSQNTPQDKEKTIQMLLNSISIK